MHGRSRIPTILIFLDLCDRLRRRRLILEGPQDMIFWELVAVCIHIDAFVQEAKSLFSS